MPVECASHPINFLSHPELRQFLHSAKVIVHSSKVALRVRDAVIIKHDQTLAFQPMRVKPPSVGVSKRCAPHAHENPAEATGDRAMGPLMGGIPAKRNPQDGRYQSNDDANQRTAT